jgi:hypothetical protein
VIPPQQSFKHGPITELTTRKRNLEDFLDNLTMSIDEVVQNNRFVAGLGKGTNGMAADVTGSTSN